MKVCRLVANTEINLGLTFIIVIFYLKAIYFKDNLVQGYAVSSVRPKLGNLE